MKSANKQKAFTIIELVVVAGILALLSLLTTTMIADGIKSYRFAHNSVSMQDTVARGVRDFEAKSRSAESIIEAEPDELAFYAYIANDIRPAPSRIRFLVIEGNFVRGVIPPVGEGPTYAYPEENEVFVELTRGVINASELFVYYSGEDYNYQNPSETELSPPINIADIKMAKITLMADNDIDKPPLPVEDSTMVNFRNLKRNL